MIVINDNNTSAATGLSFYNAVLGGDSPIFVEGLYSNPTITLSNSVLYGNIFAQEGSTTLSIPISTYGLNIATTIIGGIPINPPLPQEDRNQFYTGYQHASLTVQDGGTFDNYGGMYAFNSGTLTFSVGQQTLLNTGLIGANSGTVDVTAAPAGLLDNEGSLLATNAGTINVSSNMVLGQNGSVTVNNGALVLGGTVSGSGLLNLAGGRMEFIGPSGMNISPTVTTAFTGDTFTLSFDNATSISALLLPASGAGGHENLIVAASFSTGGLKLVDLALDTGHAYAASQFAAQAYGGGSD